MHTDFLISMANNNIDKEAFIVNNNITLYREFLTQYDDKVKYLKEHDIKQGEVVAVESDFSSQSTALLLALIDNNNIIVPLTSALGSKKEEFCKISKVSNIWLILSVGRKWYRSFTFSSNSLNREGLRFNILYQ